MKLKNQDDGDNDKKTHKPSECDQTNQYQVLSFSHLNNKKNKNKNRRYPQIVKNCILLYRPFKFQPIFPIFFGT